MKMLEVPEQDKEAHLQRLMKKVIKSDNGCWIWTGSYTQGPNFAINGRSELANRVAYAILIGPFPKKARLGRQCKNDLCVNPEHMYLYGSVIGRHRHPSPEFSGNPNP